MEKFDGRGKSRSIKKLRNLPQYKDMTDEELQALVLEKENSSEVIIQDLEARSQRMMQMFEEDYDLTDLKINDREVLKSLIRDILALEDYDKQISELRASGIDANNLLAVEKIQKVMSDLRKGISDAQNDLSITRKHRKSDQETSVIAYIESLKEKARKFYQAKMSYVLCPKCNTLLATIWTLYPEEDNVLRLTCIQKDKEGKPCGNVVTISTKQLITNRGTNNRESVPDSLL